MSKILVVGSLNLEYVIEVENMPKAGETIFGKSQDSTMAITPKTNHSNNRGGPVGLCPWSITKMDGWFFR